MFSLQGWFRRGRRLSEDGLRLYPSASDQSDRVERPVQTVNRRLQANLAKTLSWIPNDLECAAGTGRSRRSEPVSAGGFVLHASVGKQTDLQIWSARPPRGGARSASAVFTSLIKDTWLKQPSNHTVAICSRRNKTFKQLSQSDRVFRSKTPSKQVYLAALSNEKYDLISCFLTRKTRDSRQEDRSMFSGPVCCPDSAGRPSGSRRSDGRRRL